MLPVVSLLLTRTSALSRVLVEREPSHAQAPKTSQEIAVTEPGIDFITPKRSSRKRIVSTPGEELAETFLRQDSKLLNAPIIPPGVMLSNPKVHIQLMAAMSLYA